MSAPERRARRGLRSQHWQDAPLPPIRAANSCSSRLCLRPKSRRKESRQSAGCFRSARKAPVESPRAAR
eukprot:3298977-Pyramimonas_sp.AAC.1